MAGFAEISMLEMENVDGGKGKIEVVKKIAEKTFGGSVKEFVERVGTAQTIEGFVDPVVKSVTPKPSTSSPSPSTPSPKPTSNYGKGPESQNLK